MSAAGVAGTAPGATRSRPAASFSALVLVRAPELVRQGVRQLAAYRLRTALALCGIVVGVMAVVGSLSLLDGVETMMRTSYDCFFGGDRTGIVSGRSEVWRAGRRTALRKLYQVTGEDRLALAAAIPEVERVCATSFKNNRIAARRNQLEGVRIVGVEPSYFDIRRFPLASGRLLSAADGRERARVAVLFRRLAMDLFGRDDVAGEEVRIDGQRFTVIGVLLPLSGGNLGWYRQGFIPYETAIDRLGRDPAETTTWVKVAAGERFDAMQPAVVSLLTHRHPGASTDHFRVVALGRFGDQELRETRARGRILIAVALLCLAAGAVGIFNVLLISVTERRGEIGLRLALGATRRGVLGQFLFESLVLSGAGGLLGIAAARGFAALLAARVAASVGEGMLSPEMLHVGLGQGPLLVGLGLSFGTALAAGVFPAWRASRVDPAECLRRE